MPCSLRLIESMLALHGRTESELCFLCIEFLGYLFSVWYLGFVTAFLSFGIFGRIRPFLFIFFFLFLESFVLLFSVVQLKCCLS